MKIFNLNAMKMGWFIGDFDPSVFRTSDFEVGYTTHKQGEYRDPHYHREAIEITLVISGELLLNEQLFVAGDIFIIDPYEVAAPSFLTDVEVIVIKVPSVPGDKYLVEE